VNGPGYSVAVEFKESANNDPMMMLTWGRNWSTIFRYSIIIVFPRLRSHSADTVH